MQVVAHKHSCFLVIIFVSWLSIITIDWTTGMEWTTGLTFFAL